RLACCTVGRQFFRQGLEQPGQTLRIAYPIERGLARAAPQRLDLPAFEVLAGLQAWRGWPILPFLQFRRQFVFRYAQYMHQQGAGVVLATIAQCAVDQGLAGSLAVVTGGEQLADLAVCQVSPDAIAE